MHYVTAFSFPILCNIIEECFFLQSATSAGIRLLNESPRKTELLHLKTKSFSITITYLFPGIIKLQ